MEIVHSIAVTKNLPPPALHGPNDRAGLVCFTPPSLGWGTPLGPTCTSLSPPSLSSSFPSFTPRAPEMGVVCHNSKSQGRGHFRCLARPLLKERDQKKTCSPRKLPTQEAYSRSHLNCHLIWWSHQIRSWSSALFSADGCPNSHLSTFPAELRARLHADSFYGWRTRGQN